MKINPSLTSVDHGKNAMAAKGARGSQSGAAGKSAGGSGDTIQLSALSSQLHAIESSLAASGEFDTHKVEDIKEAIRDGHFTINSGVVADKLIASAQELLSKKNG